MRHTASIIFNAERIPIMKKKAKSKNGKRGMPPSTKNLVSAVDAQNRKKAYERMVSKRTVIGKR
jgi:hypothetical protein